MSSLIFPVALFEKLGGKDAFFPENDLIEDGPWDDGDGGFYYDVVGRVSWPNGKPKVLAGFHYAENDCCIWEHDEYTDGARRASNLNIRYMVNEEATCIISIGYGGIEHRDLIHYQGVPENSFYINYISLKDGEDISVAVDLLKKMCEGEGKVFIIGDVARHEEDIVRALVDGGDVDVLSTSSCNVLRKDHPTILVSDYSFTTDYSCEVRCA